MLKSHPKGLYILFFTELWERFSYYGMRAILATARMVNVQTSDVRMTLALKNYDKCKLNEQQ